MLTHLTSTIKLLGCIGCICLFRANAAFAQTPPNLPISPPFTIASGLAPGDSDTTNPGKPGIAFDGTNFLVVYCSQTSSRGINGAIVSRDRVVIKTLVIADINPIYGCAGRAPNVGYDGVNYLVVFSRVTSAGTIDIVGMRVSPSGDLLDGPDGFIIFSGAFEHAIAFDGANYLVVSVKFNNETLHDIYGARVSPSGQVLNEFPIFIAPGGQVNVSTAFDGANYLVVWSDTRSGSPVGPDADIVGTRVASSGAVLDPSGIAISSAPGAQEAPQVIFDGTNYFVVWEDTRNGPDTFPVRLDIYGTRVTVDGTLLDGPPTSGGIAINTVPVGKQHPVIGFDGTTYLVIWDEASYFPPTGIFAARVSNAGVLLDAPPDAPGIVISQPPCFPCRLVFPNVASSGDAFLLAWEHTGEGFPTGKEIVGASIPIKNSVDFSEFDANLFLLKITRGDFLVSGSFALGQTSNGFDPLAEMLVFALADEDGTFFTQTLPPGSFHKTGQSGFVFAAANSAGIRLLTINPADTPGHFRFIVAGVRVNLAGADHQAIDVKLQVGNDTGATGVNCRALGNLLICH